MGAEQNQPAFDQEACRRSFNQYISDMRKLADKLGDPLNPEQISKKLSGWIGTNYPLEYDDDNNPFPTITQKQIMRALIDISSDKLQSVMNHLDENGVPKKDNQEQLDTLLAAAEKRGLDRQNILFLAQTLKKYNASLGIYQKPLMEKVQADEKTIETHKESFATEQDSEILNKIRAQAEQCRKIVDKISRKLDFHQKPEANDFIAAKTVLLSARTLLTKINSNNSAIVQDATDLEDALDALETKFNALSETNATRYKTQKRITAQEDITLQMLQNADKNITDLVRYGSSVVITLKPGTSKQFKDDILFKKGIGFQENAEENTFTFTMNNTGEHEAVKLANVLIARHAEQSRSRTYTTAAKQAAKGSMRAARDTMRSTVKEPFKKMFKK